MIKGLFAALASLTIVVFPQTSTVAAEETVNQFAYSPDYATQSVVDPGVGGH